MHSLGRRIASLYSQGYKPREIARELNVSVREIYRSLQVGRGPATHMSRLIDEIYEMHLETLTLMRRLAGHLPAATVEQEIAALEREIGGQDADQLSS
jgi:transposase